MSKRDPSTDIPRRIYKSTVERIDTHLKSQPRDGVTVKKKIKKDFNKFLIELLNLYEELQKAEIYYVNEVFLDPAEARGAEVVDAARQKRKVNKPLMMLKVGEDE